MTDRHDTEVTTMALLTADDVLNRKFQATKFREGYDQDEVDDFLDEVVNTLRVVTGENEELKAKLAAAERRIAELTRGEGGDDARFAPAAANDGTAEDGSPVEGSADEQPVVEGSADEQPVVEGSEGESSADEEQPAVEPAATASFSAPAEATPAQAAPATSGGAPESATGMLALAQRLHDEYVRNGQEEGDRILAEAKAEGSRIVKEAEDQHNRTLTQLEQERSLLERKIDELRTFERDYRTRLKSYLESLLANVESGAPQAEGI